MDDTNQNVTVTITQIRVTGKMPEVVARVASEMHRLLMIDSNGVVIRPGEGRAASD